MATEPDDKEKAQEANSRGSNSGKLPFVALILSLVLTPAVTWAVSEFVIVPRIRSAIAEPAENPAVPSAKHGQGTAKATAEAPGVEGTSYRFENLVVNLAGTMGTRYLKTSFIVEGEDVSLNAVFTSEQVRLRDAALSVLASLTLSDLEEVGARNFIRERLVRAFNQALDRPVAEQIYFLEFVVQ